VSTIPHRIAKSWQDAGRYHTVEIIRTIAWMKQVARQARAENRIIGLVPTMGALHAGHTSLIARAKQECSPLIASIFVNPKQFGPNEDFAKYPRTFESDSEKLKQAGVDALFAPEPAEIYPKDFSTYVHVEGLSERLEGRSRPGHFRGVTTVVMKLLQIVQPSFAYFGRKDAQQARLIAQMARDLNLDTEVVVCPIVREPDGLALSSRNVYLNSEQREAATILYRALKAAKKELETGARDALQLQTSLKRKLDSERLAAADYAEIVDSETFEPVVRVSRACYVVLAVFIGKTRLIDNMLVEPKLPGSDELVFHL
jgi:pantoate--beta-alanine ligase